MSNPATHRNLLGIACLCIGVAVFSTQDAIIKGISGDYAVTQAMVTRSLVALPILALFVQWEGGLRQLLSPRFWMLTLRGLILLLAYTTYYIAFPALPLADAIALFFTAPLMITFLAVPILKERVAMKEWIAAGIGFAGVLVMLRPGSGLFEPAALLSLASAFFYAISAIVARKLGVEEKASVMAFYQNIVFLTGAGLMAMVFACIGFKEAAHPSSRIPRAAVGLAQFARFPADGRLRGHRRGGDVAAHQCLSPGAGKPCLGLRIYRHAVDAFVGLFLLCRDTDLGNGHRRNTYRGRRHSGDAGAWPPGAERDRTRLT